MIVRHVLDLVELTDDPACLSEWLRSTEAPSVEDLLIAANPGSDRTSRRAAKSLLKALGAVDGDEHLVQPAASNLADVVDVLLDLRAELLARQPPPASRLVVTATTSADLTALRRALHLRPLFHLIEDVVRSSSTRCVLGAPYWNTSALERLRPSVMGFARRGGHLEFVCQGADADDPYNPVAALRRFCRDVAGEGGTAAIWAFDVRNEEGRHALIHAKFALADSRLGYLGSANMTGQGFAEHFEIGVRLTEAEATDLAALIEQLCRGGFLVKDGHLESLARDGRGQ